MSITGDPGAFLLVSSTVFQYPLILLRKRSSVRVKHLTLEHNTTQHKTKPRPELKLTPLELVVELICDGISAFPFRNCILACAMSHFNLHSGIAERKHSCLFNNTTLHFLISNQTNKQTTGKKTMDLLYSSFRWHSATRNILISIEKDASLLPTPY